VASEHEQEQDQVEEDHVVQYHVEEEEVIEPECVRQEEINIRKYKKEVMQLKFEPYLHYTAQ
jgi:hypothetical protein